MVKLSNDLFRVLFGFGVVGFGDLTRGLAVRGFGDNLNEGKFLEYLNTIFHFGAQGCGNPSL